MYEDDHLLFILLQTVRADAIKTRAELTGTAKLKGGVNTGKAKTAGKVTGAVLLDAEEDKAAVSMLGAGVADEYEVDDDLGDAQSPAQHEKPSKPKKSPEAMSKDDLDANDAVAKRMTQKLNFLRNPRHVPVAPKASKLPTSGADAEEAKGLPPPTTAKLSVTTVGEGQQGKLRIGDTTAAAERAGVAPMSHDGEAIAGPFSVAPGRAVFNKYVVDEEYSTQLIFRNQDSVSRTLRVLPPTTQFFSMDPLVYPGKHRGEGHIAPGMSVKATVRFRPNSLAAFDDYLTVITELGSFKVPLHASMPAPQLTLPLEISAGCCIRGDELISTVVFENVGKGSGKFRVFSEEDWPVVAPGPASSEFVTFGPFELSPSYFEVLSGAHMAFTVKFSPPAVGTYTSGFVVVCDNCDVTRYTVRGESADLDVVVSKVQGMPVAPPTVVAPPESLTAVSVGPLAAAPPLPPNQGRGVPVSLSEPVSLISLPRVIDGVKRSPEEHDPAHAPVRLTFDPVPPRRAASKTVTIKNPTPIPLRFEWFADPWWTGAPPAPSADRQKPVSLARGEAAQTDSVYTVEPASGLLTPGSEMEFTITFKPNEPVGYQRMLKMCIVDVPLAGERRRRYEARLNPAARSPGGSADEEAYSPSSPGAKSAISILSAPQMLQTEDGGSVVGSSAIPRECADAVAVYLQVRLGSLAALACVLFSPPSHACVCRALANRATCLRRRASSAFLARCCLVSRGNSNSVC